MKTSCLLAISLTLFLLQQAPVLKPTSGIESVAAITLLVKDQDEALAWYTQKLGFETRKDDSTSIEGFRWLTVGPRAQPELEIVLLPAEHGAPEQVGKMTTIVLRTSSIVRAFEEMKARDVVFQGGVDPMPWGRTANFVDLYGNPWQLLEPVKESGR
jgi:catechol 2,3-dioxygenase-like lactoylglutathione lyase family enzyme